MDSNVQLDAERDINDLLIYPSPSFSPSFDKLDEKEVPSFTTALDFPTDVLPADDLSNFSPTYLKMSSLVSDTSSTPSSSSSYSPVIEDCSTASAVGQIDMDSIDLDSLLAAPMYDDDEAVTGLPLFDQISVDQSCKRKADDFDTSEISQKRQKQDHAPVAPVQASVSPSVTSVLNSPDSLPDGDSAEAKAVRRARNTASARRSRDKKRERMSELEARVAELERLNVQLTVENQVLRTLKSMPPRS